MVNYSKNKYHFFSLKDPLEKYKGHTKSYFFTKLWKKVHVIPFKVFKCNFWTTWLLNGVMIQDPEVSRKHYVHLVNVKLIILDLQFHYWKQGGAVRWENDNTLYFTCNLKTKMTNESLRYQQHHLKNRKRNWFEFSMEHVSLCVYHVYIIFQGIVLQRYLQILFKINFLYKV